MKRYSKKIWHNTFPDHEHGYYGEPYILGCKCNPCVKANTQGIEFYECVLMAGAAGVAAVGAIIGASIMAFLK
jgi:hypothetical protein